MVVDLLHRSLHQNQLYKHFLLHGLNVTVALDRVELAGAGYFRRYWWCLTVSYVMVRGLSAVGLGCRASAAVWDGYVCVEGSARPRWRGQSCGASHPAVCTPHGQRVGATLPTGEWR